MIANSANLLAIPDWLPAPPLPPGTGAPPRLETLPDFLDYYESQGLTPMLLARSRPWMSLQTRKLAAKLPVSLIHYFFPRLSSYARLRRNPAWLAQVNLGVRTGKRFKLVMIDFDDMESGRALVRECRLPATLATRTGGGGFHLFYRIPESCPGIESTHDCVAHGIDVRGEYAYCTVPPSEHGTGGRYEFVNPGHPIAVLPEAAVARFRACGVSRYWHVWKQVRNFRFLYRRILGDYFRAVVLRKPPGAA